MANTVLITGSSSGIGKATADYFHERGWNVAATMRTPPSQRPLDSSRFITPRLDVTLPKTIRSAVSETCEAFGGIDVLVNNAGYDLMGPLEAWTDDDFEHQVRVNLLGLASVTRECLPALRRSHGTIVNISSIGGRIGFPVNAAYHATKFAVEGLSESLRYELRAKGVRVRTVQPGGIRTDFISRGIKWAEHPAYNGEIEAMRRVTEKVGVRVPGPEPVARVIYRAATSRSGRLRWPAKPGPYLALRSMLPDAIWRRIIMTVLNSHARV